MTNATTPSTPTPPPPLAKGDMTPSGIRYSVTETERNFAFSCVFPSEQKTTIQQIISNKYTEFKDIESSHVLKRDNDQFTYKIELKPEALELEYEIHKKSNEDLLHIISIATKITEL